ncbi:protein LplB [Leadbettera azotonutricia ZAS-9]|uniref:Protein LplB n=2 Tax=Leadbettera azotonutricia TaxID=150829 RepID=F5YEJ4_LEAAZ|nr:protein LplB [Leadbettera azotonutricia ZAS-9]
MNNSMKNTEKPWWKRLWVQRGLQAFVFVGIAYLFVFNVIPMVGLIIAFKNYHIQNGLLGMFTGEWVGFKYFIEFFHEYNFSQILRNTVVISLLKLIFGFPVPIILAIALNEVHNRKIKRVIQTASYLPYFISWVIVSGFCVIFLNTRNGAINSVLVGLGILEKPGNFLGGPDFFWTLAVITDVWKSMGWWAILFLAAISGIDPTLYEAAIVDGAGRMSRIWNITIPAILPIITVMMILNIGGLFNGNFDQSFLLGNTGNRDTSDIIGTYVFRVGLSEGRFDYATAVGMIQSLMSVLLVFGSNKLSKKLTGSSLY